MRGAGLDLPARGARHTVTATAIYIQRDYGYRSCRSRTVSSFLKSPTVRTAVITAENGRYGRTLRKPHMLASKPSNSNCPCTHVPPLPLLLESDITLRSCVAQREGVTNVAMDPKHAESSKMEGKGEEDEHADQRPSAAV